MQACRKHVPKLWHTPVTHGLPSGLLAHDSAASVVVVLVDVLVDVDVEVDVDVPVVVVGRFTTMVAVRDGCRLSKYTYVPATTNLKLNHCPGSNAADANDTPRRR